MRRIAPIIIIAFAFVLSACAGTSAQRAATTAAAAKQLADRAIEPWSEFVEAEVDRCTAALPPADHTRAEFDACLGPAAKHDTVVMPALEAYHAAALALFVALTLDKSGPELDAARLEVARAVVELVRQIPGVDERIKQVQALVDG